MSFTRDVGGYFHSTRETYTCDLAKRGVRLLRCRRVDASAYATSLRTSLECRSCRLRRLLHATLADQLLNSWHYVSLSALVASLSDPRGRVCRNSFRFHPRTRNESHEWQNELRSFYAHYFFLERVSATKRPRISRSPREQEREGNGITLRGSKWSLLLDVGRILDFRPRHAEKRPANLYP